MTHGANPPPAPSVPGQNPTYLSTPLIPEEVARAEGELLKESWTYCPTCMRELDATVFAVRGQVWIYKCCPAHGPSQGLVERSVEFYKAVMNRPPAPRAGAYSLLVPVTHRCNLQCSICFVPRRSEEDMSAAGFARVVDEAEASWIVMSGGEPTMRDDLADLIAATRRAGKNAAMNTNGILLADRDLVKRLADAGLQYVLLAFNGASDSIYERINGRPLLDLKCEAAQNLFDENMRFGLSPTIIRGVNEDLGPVIRMCFELAPHCDQLRMRGAAQVGRHGDFDPLVTSELVELLAPEIGRTMPQLLQEFDADSCFHSSIQWIMDALFLKQEGRPGKLLYWDPGEYRFESALEPATEEIERRLRLQFGDTLDQSPELVSAKLVEMAFHLWQWPDRYTIDLEEIQGHGVRHLYDNRVSMNMVDAVNRAHEL